MAPETRAVSVKSRAVKQSKAPQRKPNKPNPPKNPSVPQMSPRIQQRYKELQGGKFMIYYERGFTLTPGTYMDMFVTPHLKQWNWSEFVKQPTLQVPVRLIHDFVAHFPDEEEPTTVPVRGVMVDISPAKIKELFGFCYPEGEYDWFTQTLINRGLPLVHAQVSKSLTGDSSKDWDSETMCTTALAKEAQIWAKFVRSRLMPKQHMNKLGTKVAVAVYCITENLPFYPERILYKELCNMSKRTSGPFYLPCLVKLLCDACAVPPHPDDNTFVPPPSSPMDEQCLKRIAEKGLCKKRSKTNPPVSSPKPIGKGKVSEMQAKIDTLEKHVHELTQFIVNAHPHWSASHAETHPDGEFPEIPPHILQAAAGAGPSHNADDDSVEPFDLENSSEA